MKRGRNWWMGAVQKKLQFVRVSILFCISVSDFVMSDLMIVPLNNLEKHGRSILNWFGEDLK